MTQNVQELIDKIKTDGIEQAEKKALEIETDAKRESSEIIAQAQRDADKILLDAKEEAKKLKESTHMALKQSSRDTILSLKKEIQAILQHIVSREIDDALTIEKLGQIIQDVIEKFISGQAETPVVIALNEKDLQILKEGFIAKLQKKMKSPIHLKTLDEAGKGFMISFDEGKSAFDFTDSSLADYMCAYLNSQISELVKESNAS